nr:MAG TPA: hypothetical protein [Caudoviricetes sp.]
MCDLAQRISYVKCINTAWCDSLAPFVVRAL